MSTGIDGVLAILTEFPGARVVSVTRHEPPAEPVEHCEHEADERLREHREDNPELRCARCYLEMGTDTPPASTEPVKSSLAKLADADPLNVREAVKRAAAELPFNKPNRPPLKAKRPPCKR